MKKPYFISSILITLSLILCLLPNSIAQVAINTDGSTPDASAMLDVKSTVKGFIFPRMTQSEIALIANPSNGLTVFNTTDNRFYYFDAGVGEWKEVAIGAGTITPIVPFTCGDVLLDSRDGKSYNTVQISTQCWMAENLNIGTMINSTTGGTNSNGDQTSNSTLEKYCYDNNENNCTTYGGLYQWNEMMEYITTPGVQGICPNDWHLPTDDEWKILEGTVDSQYPVGDPMWNNELWRGYDAGKNLKTTTGWLSGGNGSGLFDFEALPSGYRTFDGQFNQLTAYADFFSSSEVNSSYVWSRLLYCFNDGVYRGITPKESGYSVRCLQN